MVCNGFKTTDERQNQSNLNKPTITTHLTLGTHSAYLTRPRTNSVAKSIKRDFIWSLLSCRTCATTFPANKNLLKVDNKFCKTILGFFSHVRMNSWGRPSCVYLTLSKSNFELISQIILRCSIAFTGSIGVLYTKFTGKHLQYIIFLVKRFPVQFAKLIRTTFL